MKDLILVTDWERVEDTDFYLSDKWVEHSSVEEVEEARRLQSNNKLYVAYIVEAKSYAIYREMDAQQVFIDSDMNVVLECETAIIGNNHAKRVEYDY